MRGLRHMQGPQRVTAASAVQEPAAASALDSVRRSWALLAVLSVAQFMVILDATVVNVALPSIARSVGLAAGEMQWVVTAYVLASGGLVLLGGRAADVTGGRRVFLAGLAVFTAASLASGFAPVTGVLIAARAGRGARCGVAIPGGVVGHYDQLWGAAGDRAGSVGSARRGRRGRGRAGRRGTDDLARLAVGIPGQRARRGGGRPGGPTSAPPREPRCSPGRELDLRGAVLAVAGLVTLVYALAGAPAHAWGSARTGGCWR